MACDCILFDLDGTLVDTAPDLGYALNQVMLELGRQPLPDAVTRPHASAGARGLLKLGLGIDDSHPDYAPLRERFLAIYAANLSRQSRLFEGMYACLQSLGERGLDWGVVTNKPGWLTDPLMAALDFPSPACCIVSGDATANPKPDPANLLLACEVSGHAPNRCLYVGDAERDIVAGRRAGMTTVAVTYGYIENGHAPEAWQADWLIDHPAELIQCLTP